MKGKTLPIIITFIILATIVYLFTNIRQTEVVCEKKTFFDTILLKERIVSVLDGKKISKMTVVKTIILPEKYVNQSNLEVIHSSLNRTLEYLGDKVNYTISGDRIVVTIEVHKNEILLLDNIRFTVENGLQIHINSNTKSNEVIPLMIGDNYTDGEFMTFMKSRGYSCK